MCVADLNVSLLPCRHRWYRLQRSCTPNTNLANCPNKLGISGWENRCEFCPFCLGWTINPTEYRLLGNDRAPAVGGLSRTPSASLSATRRETRRGSLARTDSSTSITMMAQEKNRAMNARVDAYFRVPSEGAPSTPSSQPAPFPGPLTEVDDEENGGVTTSPSDTSSEGHESLRNASMSKANKAGILGKMRRKSKKMSLGMFK